MLGGEAWRELSRAFREEGRDTPAPSADAAFVAFLQRRAGRGIDPPWLHELAHFEHALLSLGRADPSVVDFRAEGNLLDGVPALSPVLPLAYRWPVDAIGPELAPDAPVAAATLLVARRDARGRVHVARVSAFEHALLVSLSTNRWPGRRHLVELARGLRDDPSQVLALGRALLERLRLDGIVLGTRIDPHLGIDRHHGAMEATAGV